MKHSETENGPILLDTRPVLGGGPCCSAQNHASSCLVFTSYRGALNWPPTNTAPPQTRRRHTQPASLDGFAPLWFPWHIPGNSGETGADSKSPSIEIELQTAPNWRPLGSPKDDKTHAIRRVAGKQQGLISPRFPFIQQPGQGDHDDTLGPGPGAAAGPPTRPRTGQGSALIWERGRNPGELGYKSVEEEKKFLAKRLECD